MADDRSSGLVLDAPPAAFAPAGIEVQLELWGHVSVDGIDFFLGIEVGSPGARLLISTRNPVTNEGMGISVERAVRFFAEQFGFQAPTLSGAMKIWEPLYQARIYPELSVSVGRSRTFAGKLELERPVAVPIPGLDNFKLVGVQLEYRTQPKTFDFGINVLVDGREETLRFPFATPTPKPPLLDLRYFGVGQRISVPPVEGPPSIARTIAELKELLRPKEGAAVMTELRKRYAPESNWLVGAEFAISDLLVARFLFNDPFLYGLGVEVATRALAGLRFEILYKRISDEVGVFFIDLTLPLAFRTIMLGPVALTLPSVAVSVYTNGDFEVAIGWPLGERSITVQVFPFVGGGGLYFAKLSSATSPAVPPGLAPVLAFGIALRLGLGKEIRAGILTASFSIWLYGVFEGRLGFRAGGAIAETMGPVDYFWFRGTFGIVGLVEGAVDFAIIKARVLVRVEASATVTFETGKPTHLRIQASVMIALEIEIGGFRIFGVRIAIIIPLRFRADLTQDFVLQASGMRTRLASRTPPRPLRWRADAAPVRLAEPELVPLHLATQVTVVDGQPTFVAGLTIEVPPEAAARSAFGRVCGALGRWLIACHLADPGTGAVVTVLDAEALDAQLLTEDLMDEIRARLNARRWLNARDGGADPLTYEQIIAYLSQHFVFEVGAQPVAPPAADGATEAPLPSAVFPMFGEITLRARQAPGAAPYVDVHFAATAQRSETYRRLLARYYEELEIGYRPPPQPARSLDGDDGLVAMVELLFEDYAAMILDDVGEQLVARVRRGPVRLAQALEEIDYRTLAAKVSRVMQAGLRVPRDIPENPATWPRLPQLSLYRMTGQQFTLDVGPQTFTVELDVPASTSAWLRPQAGNLPLLTIPEGDAVARAALDRLRGLVVAPNVESRAPLPWLASRPMQFNLRNDVRWTLAGATPSDLRLVALGEPVAALARARDGITLAVRAEQGGPEVSCRPAMRIPLSLSPVARARRTDLEPDGEARAVYENIYQVAGASEAARRALTDLLNDPDLLAQVASIAFAFPVTDATAPGLMSQPDARILLAKTNLSTSSNPDAERLLRAGMRGIAGLPDPQWATPAQREAFLTLLWECSIVNSGGFYLRYAATDGSDPLAARFAGEPTLPVSVLVTFAESVEPRITGVTTDVVVAPPSPDVATWVVDVRGEHTAEPQVPAGCVGFSVERKNPRATGTPGDMAVEVAALYNLLQYRIVPRDDSGFIESMWSVPVGPAERDDPQALERTSAVERPLWRYQHVPAVYRFALPNVEAPEPNRYAGMGDVVHLEFRIVDAYGNRLSEQDPVGLPGLALRYADRLFAPDQWPGSRVAWRVWQAEGVPRLAIDVRFRMDAIIPGARAGERPTLEQVEAAVSALSGYDIIHDQVRDPNVEWTFLTTLAPADPLRVDVAPFAALVARVRATLRQVAAGDPFPAIEDAAEIARDISPEMLARQEKDLFELGVSLQVERVRFVDDTAATEIPAVRRVVCNALPDLEVAPSLADVDGVSTELERFARDFERVFGGALKVALGRDDVADRRRRMLRARARGLLADDDPGTGALWAVRVGTDGIAVAAGGAPSYYAPTPLSTRLLSAEFVVRKYESRQAGLAAGEERPELFENVDLDAWAWTFLDVFDQFLQPELALAIATLDPARYDRLMQCKERLARAIVRRIAPVLTEDAPADTAREAAEAALYQRLLVSLSSAYEVSAIAQVPVEVRRAHPQPGAFDRMRYYGGIRPTVAAELRVHAGEPVGTSYSSPRVALWSGAAGTDPARFVTTVTTLVTPAKNDARTHERTTLRYDIGYLEHDIAEDASPEERHYLPGSWLRFVVTSGNDGVADPALSVSLGTLDIPLPLRRFPPGMRVRGASATPSVPHPQTLEEALRWRYAVNLEGELTAHDVVRSEVRYNVSPARPSMRGGYCGSLREQRQPPASLFEALARFTAEQEQVIARFPLLPEAAWRGGDRDAALAVIDAFLELAEGAASTWTAHQAWRSASDGALLEIVHEYELAWRDRIACDPEAPIRPRLRVRRMWHDNPPTGWPPWPELDGWRFVAQCPPEGDMPPHQDAYYEPVPVSPLAMGEAVAEPTGDQWAVALDRLHVMTRQNALTAVQVVRNVDLVPGRSTTPAFTYVTPWSASPAPVTPRIEVGPLGIDDLGGETLADVLGKLFSRLFALESADALHHPAGSAAADAERRRLLTLGVEYSNTAVRVGLNQAAPRARLPLRLAEEVQFLVPEDCDPNRDQSFVRRLAKSLGGWYQATQPSTLGGELWFAITVFGNFSTAKSPVLQFHRLRLTVSDRKEWWTK